MGKMKLKKPKPKKIKPADVKYQYEYRGNLELYYETGYEGMHAVILADTRGNSTGPHWDKEKAAAGETSTYKTLEWAHFFDKHETSFITVIDPEGVIVYEGPIDQDRMKIVGFDYRLSYIPKQVETKDWVMWCSKEYNAIVRTNRPVLAQDEKYQEEKRAMHEKWAKQKEEEAKAKAEQK